jgi:hypothetical protein
MQPKNSHNPSKEVKQGILMPYNSFVISSLIHLGALRGFFKGVRNEKNKFLHTTFNVAFT